MAAAASDFVSSNPALDDEDIDGIPRSLWRLFNVQGHSWAFYNLAAIYKLSYEQELNNEFSQNIRGRRRKDKDIDKAEIRKCAIASITNKPHLKEILDSKDFFRAQAVFLFDLRLDQVKKQEFTFHMFQRLRILATYPDRLPTFIKNMDEFLELGENRQMLCMSNALSSDRLSFEKIKSLTELQADHILKGTPFELVRALRLEFDGPFAQDVRFFDRLNWFFQAACNIERQKPGNSRGLCGDAIIEENAVRLLLEHLQAWRGLIATTEIRNIPDVLNGIIHPLNTKKLMFTVAGAAAAAATVTVAVMAASDKESSEVATQFIKNLPCTIL